MISSVNLKLAAFVFFALFERFRIRNAGVLRLAFAFEHVMNSLYSILLYRLPMSRLSNSLDCSGHIAHPRNDAGQRG
uniref:Uncharacterized protein n=1 Tax=Ixodes ricinus TaxID=34613 RepID=A0A6B0U311_IXORI